MKNRDIGAEILAGIKEISEFKKGNLPLKVTALSEPSAPQISKRSFRQGAN